MLSTKNVFLALSASVLLFSSCSNDPATPVEPPVDSTATKTTEAEGNKKIFYAMPSPIQLGKMLKKAGANYDGKMLNSKENLAKYNNQASKALNLGVYGADLSYAAIFNQTQDVMTFVNSAKKLADELGTSGAFASENIKHLEANINNNDSLLQMIADMFLNSDAALKENDQTNIASYAIAGGFIEGLYIGTQVAKTTKDNAAIVKRIAEMKGAITNLSMMLGGIEGEERMKSIVTELSSIKSIYDQMQTNSDASVVKSDTTQKTTTIGGSATYNFTKEQLDELTKKVEALRASIIN